MAIQISVVKADPVGDQLVPEVRVRIEGKAPDFENLVEAEVFYEAQAELVFTAFRSLPGGTFDRLLGKMLAKRASLLLMPLWGGVMSKTYHQKLVDKVTDFIRRVHTDRSVSLEQTLESLEVLRNELDECIVAIKEDMGR